MAKLDIISAPHPILKQKAEPVAEVNDEIRQLMDDMLETMADQWGLAANQIGRRERVLVADTREDENRKISDPLQRLCMANPEIIESAKEMVSMQEGCLSVPGFRIDIARPEWVVVSYLDYNNKQQQHKFDGYRARVIQHELDHLNGILMVDYLSGLKKNVIIRKLTKQKKLQQAG